MEVYVLCSMLEVSTPTATWDGHRSWQDLRADGATRVEATAASSTGAATATTTAGAGQHRGHGSHDGGWACGANKGSFNNDYISLLYHRN